MSPPFIKVRFSFADRYMCNCLFFFFFKEEQQQFSAEEIESEDPYYVSLGKLDDLMPKHCQFGSISREEAVR